MSGGGFGSTDGEHHRALASPVRERLVGLLRPPGSPQDAHELASATGLHVSTVRFHLDVLVRAGLVVSQPLHRTTPGRPRTTYAMASAGNGGRATSYQDLAAMLAAGFGGTAQARSRRAEKAGRAWAEQLVPRTGRPPSQDRHRVAVEVTALFTELGFDPELTRDGTTHHLRLTACPFRAVARAHTEVVCSAHLGLLMGVAERLAVEVPAASLRPFVTPTTCIASLAPQPSGTDR